MYNKKDQEEIAKLYVESTWGDNDLNPSIETTKYQDGPTPREDDDGVDYSFENTERIYNILDKEYDGFDISDFLDSWTSFVPNELSQTVDDDFFQDYISHKTGVSSEEIDIISDNSVAFRYGGSFLNDMIQQALPIIKRAIKLNKVDALPKILDNLRKDYINNLRIHQKRNGYLRKRNM